MMSKRFVAAEKIRAGDMVAQIPPKQSWLARLLRRQPSRTIRVRRASAGSGGYKAFAGIAVGDAQAGEEVRIRTYGRFTVSAELNDESGVYVR